MIFPFKHLISQIILISFFFQTLWPTVAFGRIEVSLGHTWREDLSGLTFKVQRFKERGTDRELARIQAYIKEDDSSLTEEVVEKAVALPKVDKPSVLPPIAETIKEDTPPPSSTVSSVTSSSHSLGDKVKKLLERIVDIKTSTILDQGYAIYNDLTLKEEGIGWAFGGLAFILDKQWNVMTTGNANFHMALKVCAKGAGTVSFDNVSAKQILAQGQDVIVRGTSNIGRLDAWATGEGKKPGAFRVTEESSQKIDELFVHQGKGENLGHLKIQESLNQTEEFEEGGALYDN